MSEQNVAIARAALEAFNEGDFEQLLRLAREDMRIYSPPDMPNPGEFFGREGFMLWLGRWMEAWETFTVDMVEPERVDDRWLVARVVQRGTGRGSGIATEMSVWYLWEMRDGRMAQFHIYREREDALAAVAAD
jgi:ketosteroid isomerase-like protein